MSKVRAFSAAHLGNYHDAMLYFFSGPDFLYATSFFPHASTYVLAGLEPVGDIPQLTDLAARRVDQTLQNLRRSTDTILNISFFITKNMQIAAQRRARSSAHCRCCMCSWRVPAKTVHEASFVSLDAQGNFITPNDAGKHSAGNLTHGVQIVFSDGNGPQQTLYYFSTDLSDSGVKRIGLPRVSAPSSARRQLHQKRFIPAAHQAASAQCAISCSITAPPSCRTTAAFRSPYFDSKKWRLAAVRPLSRAAGDLSRTAVSREWRNCSAMPRRSISASAIAGSAEHIEPAARRADTGRCHRPIPLTLH